MSREVDSLHYNANAKQRQTKNFYSFEKSKFTSIGKHYYGQYLLCVGKNEIFLNKKKNHLLEYEEKAEEKRSISSFWIFFDFSNVRDKFSVL